MAHPTLDHGPYYHLYIHHPDGTSTPIHATPEQADGKACIRCGRDITSRLWAWPLGDVPGWAWAWACAPDCTTARHETSRR